MSAAPPAVVHQHRVIGDASATIGRFLRDRLVDAGYPDLALVDTAPTADAVASLPALVVYLHGLAVDHEGIDGNATPERVAWRGDDGEVVRYARRQRLWLRLDYLVAAFARTPRDEQILLGSCLRAVMEAPVLRGADLRGAAFEADAELPLVLSGRGADEPSRLWSSFGQPVRPSFNLWTTVPLVAERLEREAPAPRQAPRVAAVPLARRR